MYFLEDLDEEDYEIAIKVVVVGNGAVGKSSMIQRYCKGIFTTDYKKTIGVDFLEKHVTASGEDVRLMLWDTAGQEEFDAITKAYYRGAQACVVAFSTTDRASFDAVKKWKRKVEDECGHIPMVLVQNKIDLLHEAQVDSYEVEKFARNTGLKLFRTSVKENLNIARVFQFLSERHIESVSRWSTDDPSANEHDFSFQIGQNTNRDVRVRFAGFPDDGNNSNSHSNVNNHHSQNGKLNSGSRLRNNHNNSLTGNVNNGGIFLHKVSGMNNGCYSWHPTMSSSASSSNNSSLVPSPPPEKTIILNPFRKRNRNKNKNNNVNVYPWSPSHNGYHFQNGYHSYNGAQNNGYNSKQRSPLRYNNNCSFSLQPQPHHQSSSQKPACKMI